MTVLGEVELARFAMKHAAARKPLGRFLAVARAAVWPHFPAVKQTFPSVDYAPASGTIIFDIGDNKYRLIAVINFERQIMSIEEVLTHEEYERENL
jgi:mRNA interferase HigB